MRRPIPITVVDVCGTHIIEAPPERKANVRPSWWTRMLALFVMRRERSPRT